MDGTAARRPSEIVLTTYELVENILSHLPSMIDLAKAQQACHLFQTVTTRSKVLREKLFLEYDPCEFESEDRREVQLHPLLQHGSIPLRDHRYHGHQAKCRLERDDVKHMLRWQSGHYWEEMLLSKPPLEKVIIYGVKGTRGYRGTVTVENSNGVRLGALIQGIWEWDWETNTNPEANSAESRALEGMTGLFELIEME